jgi:hypothetical protein
MIEGAGAYPASSSGGKTSSPLHSSVGTVENAPAKTGGKVAFGGSLTAGGAISYGGSISMGGSKNVGGNTSGGKTTALPTNGGMIATGGKKAKGGATTTGGTTSFGGATETGGTTVIIGGAVAMSEDPSGLFLNGFFPIGVFSQKWETIAEWKNRGINTMVEEHVHWGGKAEQNERFWQWDAECRRLGLKMIRYPAENLSEDIGNPNLIAWLQEDEPDAYGEGEKNLPDLQKKYKLWKSVNPSLPVFVNFGGSDVMSMDYSNQPGVKSKSQTVYEKLCATADWIANDLYPVNGYLNSDDVGRRGDLTLIGNPIDRLAEMTGKPQFAFIETCEFQENPEIGRGVTPDEMRAQVWLTIVHGVRGYIYFPQLLRDPTPDDGTPPNVVEEMKRVNAMVTQIAPVLQGQINPPQIGATVTSPVQVAWRRATDGDYFIAVNPGKNQVNATLTLTGVNGLAAAVLNQNRTVTITADKKIVDTFPPYSVNIYVIKR